MLFHANPCAKPKSYSGINCLIENSLISGSYTKILENCIFYFYVSLLINFEERGNKSEDDKSLTHFSM